MRDQMKDQKLKIEAMYRQMEARYSPTRNTPEQIAKALLEREAAEAATTKQTTN